MRRALSKSDKSRNLTRLGIKEVEEVMIKALLDQHLQLITLGRGRGSEENLQKVVERLNHRPRKCLGYKIPVEVCFLTPLYLA